MSNKIVLATAIALLAVAPLGTGAPTLPDNGTGTANLPPAPWPYANHPQEPLMIIDGLPPGTTINIDALLGDYSNMIEAPGGSLGGNKQQFDAGILMLMAGTGGLAGYNRAIWMPISNETHSGPRNPGDAVQSFDQDWFLLQGQLPPGDPDFDLLRITAGTGFGLPSPGHTTLTRLGPPGSDFAVDSFFDITYRIDFVGAPGAVLAGMSGSTTQTVRISLIPEPATMAILALGGLLALFKRTK